MEVQKSKNRISILFLFLFILKILQLWKIKLKIKQSGKSNLASTGRKIQHRYCFFISFFFVFVSVYMKFFNFQLPQTYPKDITAVFSNQIIISPHTVISVRLSLIYSKLRDASYQCYPYIKLYILNIADQQLIKLNTLPCQKLDHTPLCKLIGTKQFRYYLLMLS